MNRTINRRPSIDPTEFAGKRALVTGGTKGMGEATVARLRRGGAHVVTTARNRPAALQNEADFVQADVSTPEGALPSRGNARTCRWH
jgi:NAD(P)-dependent dehydrogenase (short-subunit alcohol dehydrogenase family)